MFGREKKEESNCSRNMTTADEGRKKGEERISRVTTETRTLTASKKY